jgi:hypothetical protein
MKVWRHITLTFLALFLFAVSSYSQDEISTPISQNIRGTNTDVTGLWRGTWESRMRGDMTGAVKATMHQENQKVEALLELEHTTLGDIRIQASGTLLGQILFISGKHAGYVCLIQGWWRDNTLSGFYEVLGPDRGHYDWGQFEAELLEIHDGLEIT